MTKNYEVYDRLTKVNGEKYDTGLKLDKDSKSISIDNYGTFLNDVADLPSNEELDQEFSDSLKKDVSNEDSRFKREYIDKFHHIDFRYKDIFDKESKDYDPDGEFNNNYMFLAMNCAARPNLERSEWKMFHDVDDKHDSHMLNLRLMINNIDAKGCYVTDAIKQCISSDSSYILKEFFVKKPGLSFNNSDVSDEERAEQLLKWDKEKHIDMEHALTDVKEKRDIYDKSIDVLIHELNSIKPKQVVIFGTTQSNPDTDSNTGLVKMISESKKFDEYENGAELRKLLQDAISVTHYGNRHYPSTRDFYMKFKDAIKNKLD
ncbi:hypothetical protein [Companilactobacillus bobalius]|uniref:Uncharacterized protein n=2 Tax=Companilactobacillus bobalius TaxID=2801451 RepID=A0A202FAV7_9LACO|nr:hypothetical protein [Companilactobacillus bobalius]KAE9562500.1 hypothetical protein ATN92_04210 [Companilactobacillus bobalius]KRK81490.1 hypothetical protein FC78_GL000542 [Companilactobacillus bobalius DSM 19674]OVE97563.1 hypothetical protein LKACC16343_01444 [Companilactobacillus bobalius]GEO57826.1 hypothetical protein LBO01_09550 [Companilactobacillus paralimentarius]